MLKLVIIGKRDFGAGVGEGKSYNGTTRICILMTSFGGEEEAEAKPRGFLDFNPLRVKAGAKDARAEGARAEAGSGLPRALPRRYHGQS